MTVISILYLFLDSLHLISTVVLAFIECLDLSLYVPAGLLLVLELPLTLRYPLLPDLLTRAEVLLALDLCTGNLFL